jgi:hypothetical protein
MKILMTLVLLLMFSGAEYNLPQENIEFVCIKTNKATNTCYFNFKVDGGKYTYTDKGCKKSKSKEETIKKVKDGKLALSKDWKIDCPEAKENN